MSSRTGIGAIGVQYHFQYREGFSIVFIYGTGLNTDPEFRIQFEY